jgi:hypothetical protein
LFWFACAWETLLVLLLALFDLLLVRSQARAARKASRDEFFPEIAPHSAGDPDEK